MRKKKKKKERKKERKKRQHCPERKRKKVIVQAIRKKNKDNSKEAHVNMHMSTFVNKKKNSSLLSFLSILEKKPLYRTIYFSYFLSN